MKSTRNWIGLIAVGGAALAFAFIYFGVYDVAAARPHTSATHWLLGTMTARSVAARAKKISEEDIPDLSDSTLVRLGSEHFAETCASCHGAPGVDRSEMAEGLNPEPPALHDSLTWTDRELFWIVENGMKFTGMPAFGSTHSEEDLWSMVALIRRLPELSPEEYAVLAETAAESGSAGHEHGLTESEGPAEEPRDHTHRD